MQLLPYIQLTDYDGKMIWNGGLVLFANCFCDIFLELHEGVLLPLRKLFNSTMTPMERLIVLHYLHKLVMHWVSIEYFRYAQWTTQLCELFSGYGMKKVRLSRGCE